MYTINEYFSSQVKHRKILCIILKNLYIYNVYIFLTKFALYIKKYLRRDIIERIRFVAINIRIKSIQMQYNIYQ